MEFIEFNSVVKIADVLSIAERIVNQQAVELEFSGDLDAELNCFSNAIYGVGQTLCFLERPVEDDLAVKLGKSLVITNRDTAESIQLENTIVVDDPRALYIDLVAAIEEEVGVSAFSSLITTPPGVDSSAIIHSSAIIEKDVVISAGVIIGAGCVIKSGTYIGKNVVIRENTVIGCDGITVYKAKDGRKLKFPHLSGVIISDNVEVGAGCVLPRGMLTSTQVGNDVVIGNLSNIGHGAIVGDNVWMSVGVLIGGNTTIQAGATIGLGTCVKDNILIGMEATIGMGSVVTKSVDDGLSMFGNPAKKIPGVGIKSGPVR